MSASDNLIPVVVSKVVDVNSIIKRFEFKHINEIGRASCRERV